MRSAEILTSLRVAALFGAAFLAGCSGSPAGDPNAPLALAASAVEVLGSFESLAVVRDLEVLNDGSVWVFNSVEPYSGRTRTGRRSPCGRSPSRPAAYGAE